MAGVECRFVGRTYELGVLEAALTQVRGGRPKLVVVEGPEGIGKTALIRRFADYALGIVVFSVTARRPEAGVAWSALDRLLAALPAEVGTQATRTMEAAHGQGYDSARGGDAVAELLAGVAGQSSGVLVVVLDNGQWVDPLSAQTLRIAFSHLGECPVLVILGMRQNLQARWGRLCDDDRAEQLGVSGLTAADLGLLAAARGMPIGLWAARRLADHTAGNPLHACALIQELDRDVLAHGSGPLPAPRALSAAFAAKLGACSLPAQAVVSAVAVLGSPASLEDAGRLAGVGNPLSALDEATQAGMLVEVAGGRRSTVSFVEPLAAAAAYYQLGPSCRGHLHLRAVELTVGEAQLAHRVASARILGCDERASLVEELDALARGELADGVPGSAGAHFGMAADLSERREERCRHLVSSARASVDAGDAAAAEMRVARAAELDPDAVPTVLLGRIELLRGQASGAGNWLELAWGRACQLDDPPAAARAAASLAVLAVHRGRTQEEERWAAPSSTDACEATREVSAFIHYFGLALDGRTAEGLQVLRKQALSCARYPGTALARGALALFSDHLIEARAELVGVIARREGRGRYDQLNSHGLALLADVEYRLGSWDDAITHAELAVLYCEEAGRPWHAALTHAVAVRPLIARGDLARAAAHAEAASQIAREKRVELVAAAAARASAALEMARGNPTDALAYLDVSKSECAPADPGVFGDGDARVLALIALSRLDEAEEALCLFERQALSLDRCSALAQAARARAGLIRAQGDPAGAHAHYGQAREYLEGLGMPWEEARLCLAYGEALAEDSKLDEARSQLERAHLILATLRASPLLQACNRSLTALAQQRRAHLTPAEARVARLALAGLTNCEIAANLYLSGKTVESHLSHIYTKLGISRRSQLHLRLGHAGGP